MLTLPPLDGLIQCDKKQFVTKPFSLLFLAAVLANAQSSFGPFTNQSNVGVNPKPGSAQYDAAESRFRVTGGGANIWSTEDAFHYVWKRVSGNLTMTADMGWIGTGTVPHRKAALMIRQSLDADSPYADVAWHGDGLTSLQYRAEKGGNTSEVRSSVNAPSRIRIVRHDDQFTIAIPNDNGQMEESGPVTVLMKDPVYVGLAVCSHNADAVETATFSNVSVETERRERLISVLSTFDLQSNYAQVMLRVNRRIEAPNWSTDGKFLVVNGGGDLFRVAMDHPLLERIDVQGVFNINNDHGISPDGKLLAVSARGPAGASQVYVASMDGKTPRLVTARAPSYFHAFSPDGQFLAFVGQRESNFDLFRVPVSGGSEERLTFDPGYDDGPDYSRDGKWIYFNSNRSGSWDIWRIPANGRGGSAEKAERVTSDDLEDWFPHPSPDGRWIVFLSFPKGTEGHPPNQHVYLRRIPYGSTAAQGVKPETLLRLFGGQGTMNVNSWSPDSTHFAFVRYETGQ